jgi:two-component system CheB/CheR fusion protein
MPKNSKRPSKVPNRTPSAAPVVRAQTAAERGAAIAVPFPVVAIGASAGGLEALVSFLGAVPARSGMAYVIVQHLDPTRKGMLVELLVRGSPIPVVQVTDGMRLCADQVFVIPPNKDLSVVHGILHLLEPDAPRGLRHPIDFFFRSIADDQRQRSVGVVLSGMGSDGTLGLRAIREKAGSVFAQTPSTAKFDAMPRSAIDAGVVDVVAPAEELPGRIAAFIAHARHVTRPDAPTSDGADEAIDGGPDARLASGLAQIVGLLRTATGHDFSLYKTSTMYRRIERRMALHQLGDVAHYVRFVRENAGEADLLFKELLIGVTSFFRDPAAWELLKSGVLTRLLAAAPKNAVLRAWVPACSTGEEAYSLAICFREALDELGGPRGISLQIFATDLDPGAVERARQGLYPAGIAAAVSPERLDRFFVQDGASFRVRKEVRDRVVFATQNVLQDPPFTKLDVLCCRNLLIYLTAEAQRRLIPLFHYSLKPGGALFLGSASTVGAYSDLFAPLDPKVRIYRRLEPAAGSLGVVEFPSTFAPVADPEAGPQGGAGAKARDAALAPNLQSQVETVLLQRFAPAGVLVSAKGDVLFVSGRTGAYLEVPAGKSNWNVLAMARDGLRVEIAGALERVARTRRGVSIHGARVGEEPGARTVNVAVEPLDEPAGLRGTVLIVFSDITAPAEEPVPAAPKGANAASERARLIRDLQRVKDELRLTRDGAQLAQEELKSTNEELQSTNEELQSTNEELTTSKEEMQSMNEELQTLNAELQAKVDDLSRASNDMKNLLDSTGIAVLFLDDALLVRRFTPEAATLIKLIPSDVGRPLADLATTLEYPELYDDARAVLRTLAFKETAVDAGRKRRFTVRIMPYRTSDNRIDGVVITFVGAASTAAPAGVPTAAPPPTRGTRS